MMEQELSVPGVLAGTVNSTFRVILYLEDSAPATGEQIMLAIDFQHPVKPNDIDIVRREHIFIISLSGRNTC